MKTKNPVGKERETLKTNKSGDVTCDENSLFSLAGGLSKRARSTNSGIESNAIFPLLINDLSYLAFIGAGIVELRRFEHQNPVGRAGPVEDAETAVGRVDVTAGRHDVPISPSNPRNLSQVREKWGTIELEFINCAISAINNQIWPNWSPQ